jgi:hypothetical protein
MPFISQYNVLFVCSAFSKAEEWWDFELQTVVQKPFAAPLPVSGLPLSTTITATTTTSNNSPLPMSLEEITRQSCVSSLSVCPQRLLALLFYSQTPMGAKDLTSLHAACPVLPGDTKWVANIWVWNGKTCY